MSLSQSVILKVVCLHVSQSALQFILSVCLSVRQFYRSYYFSMSSVCMSVSKSVGQLYRSYCLLVCQLVSSSVHTVCLSVRSYCLYLSLFSSFFFLIFFSSFILPLKILFLSSYPRKKKANNREIFYLFGQRNSIFLMMSIKPFPQP